MGKRPTMTTQEYLTSAPLPEQTETYTVISHQTVIDATKKTLDAMGFEIEREFYRCNEGALVASGIYHLKYSDDPDIGMLFAWANSYDKSMKFQCSVGGYVHESLASIIGGNMGSWGRKHTGNADDEALETIQNQLMKAEEYFKLLLEQKEAMKKIVVSNEKRADIVGRMYFNNDLLTTEQMSVIKNEFVKPSHVVSGVDDSLWKMYHAIIIALQKSHPKTWMVQQKLVHELLEKEFLFYTAQGDIQMFPVQDSVVTVNKPEVDPRQLDLEEVIKEVEQEQVQNVSAVITHILVTPDPDDYVTSVEEDGWPCVQCGTMQDATAIWHDGQLCTSCVNKN